MTNRFRMWVILSVLSLSACSSRSASTPELPQSISPGWQLSSFGQATGEWIAVYRGPGAAQVRIQAIANEAVGLDRIQKFRASATSVAFYSEHYFTVVSWESAGPEQAKALVKALEGALK